MYSIAVPVTLDNFARCDRDKAVEEIRRLGASRVFIGLSTISMDLASRQKVIQSLKEQNAFLKKHGFETGAWLWTFAVSGENTFTHMQSPKGQISKELVCPMDTDYQELMGTFLEELAGTGVDIIQFDDDYRYGFIDIGFGCTCPLHQARIEEILGKKISQDDLSQSLLYGEGNEIRNAFLKANGEALENFAAVMRKHVDRVNPSIRLGFCSCITSWDIDGTTPDRISRIMAGNTKPFYRLIGAPYWAVRQNWGNRMADVIDMERIEALRRENPDIEIFSEGDVYPRPRFKTPAALLEGFDLALRVDDHMDGILKYALDYFSTPDYETGYVDAHVRNADVYRKLPEYFDGRRACGIRVYDQAQKYASMKIPACVEGTGKIEEFAFNATARAMAACSMPAIFEGDGCLGAAFGEDVRAVPREALSRGLILDMRAAEILSESGIDTGYLAIEGTGFTTEEYFQDKDCYVHMDPNTAFRKVQCAPDAKIESWFVCGADRYPASWLYENKQGMRFLVFAFDGYFAGEMLTRQYTRADQIASDAVWLSGKPIPVVCKGHPDLYIQVKETDHSISVGLWNFFPDTIYDGILEVSGHPTAVRGLECHAAIGQDGLVHIEEIPAYRFAAVEIFF